MDPLQAMADNRHVQDPFDQERNRHLRMASEPVDRLLDHPQGRVAC